MKDNNHSRISRKVLLIVGSRHGSTTGIGEVIASTLRKDGLTVDLHNPDDFIHMGDYDAAILGSAIYDGSWLPEMIDAAVEYRFELLHMPVYIFSSGPIGMQDIRPHQAGIDVQEVVQLVRPREHQVFHGALYRKTMGVIERLRAQVLNTPEGDEREWADIISWARHLSIEIKKLPVKNTLFYL